MAGTLSWKAVLAGAALLAACGGGCAHAGVSPSADPAAASASDSLTAAACEAADSAGAVSLADADIAIVTTVRARSVQHREAPRADVSFPGATPADTVECDTRRNLDRPVRARRTYRDVEVRYRAMTRIDTAAVLRAVEDSARAAGAAREP
ncbi:MAG TPA: hypothetical protein VHG91_22090 [Longimicrobium sp.]|nr:hypothetical protein [Longimicrobium sp.]